MLSFDDIIIEIGNGGLHIYCIHDLPDAYKNAYIDYITSYRYDTKATIMLPRSYNTKGRCQFIQSSYDSTIKRTSSEALRNINNKINLEQKFNNRSSDESTIHECNLTD